MGIEIAFHPLIMRVRLTRKLADCIDGVDLRGHEVDEVLDVSPKDARLLMAEEWAIVERRSANFPHSPERRSTAHDSSHRSSERG